MVYPSTREEQYDGFDYLHPNRRETVAAGNIGGENVPVVIATRKADQATAEVSSPELPKPDYIYVQGELPEKLGKKQKYILDYDAYMDLANSGKQSLENVYPIFPVTGMPFISAINSDVKFLVRGVPCLSENTSRGGCGMYDKPSEPPW